MGKGKGNPIDWVHPVTVGQVLFEIKQNPGKLITYSQAKSYFSQIFIKFPIHLKFISLPKYVLLEKECYM